MIIIDSREKNNKHITDFFDKKKIKYIEKKLSWGDYSAYIPANTKVGIHRDLFFSNICAIERKSGLVELSGNLTKERSRIENEFIRKKGNFMLLIENNSIDDIFNHNYQTQFLPNSYLATLLTFQHKYNFTTSCISKENSGRYIYLYLYYGIRQWLKGEG